MPTTGKLCIYKTDWSSAFTIASSVNYDTIFFILSQMLSHQAKYTFCTLNSQLYGGCTFLPITSLLVPDVEICSNVKNCTTSLHTGFPISFFLQRFLSKISNIFHAFEATFNTLKRFIPESKETTTHVHIRHEFNIIFLTFMCMNRTSSGFSVNRTGICVLYKFKGNYPLFVAWS